MRHCVFVIGTRAQLVKVAPVLTLASESKLEHVVWFTGQHDESIQDLISDFGIASEIIRPSNQQERSSILRLITWFPGTLFRCWRYLRSVKTRTASAPLVIVHGDTLSTYLGALAARFAGGWTVHLESGLTSGKITDPFPEELLRRLTFRLTRVALCPNDDACERMRSYNNCTVIHTGENTLLDCVRIALESAVTVDNAATDPYFVTSIHRFQNIYHRAVLEKIVDELIALAQLSTVHFILHPATEIRLKKYGLYERLKSTRGILLRPRMPYTEFLALIAAARGVISDGGSNQEELSYLGVPTVLFRERSERPDGFGANVILRGDAMRPLAEFVRSGKLDELRKESRIQDSVHPSQITIETLSALAQQNSASG
ncbi:MAG: UDP-N-acetylglucosamine 2-epimerase [Gammaproteobacteria bacterium]|nr:UDP-N-acetylglucosamine 2-epimerase [Gammaproteobacteria bacterium]